MMETAGGFGGWGTGTKFKIQMLFGREMVGHGGGCSGGRVGFKF